MSQKTFNSTKELDKYINTALTKALYGGVALEVRQEYQKQIRESVYDVYTPKKYQRRGDNGGLSDLDNIMVDLSASTAYSMFVVNVARASDPLKKGWEYDPIYNTDFASWIENGEVKDLWGQGGAWTGKRPFTKNTVMALIPKIANMFEKYLKL